MSKEIVLYSWTEDQINLRKEGRGDAKKGGREGGRKRGRKKGREEGREEGRKASLNVLSTCNPQG